MNGSFFVRYSLRTLNKAKVRLSYPLCSLWIGGNTDNLKITANVSPLILASCSSLSHRLIPARILRQRCWQLHPALLRQWCAQQLNVLEVLPLLSRSLCDFLNILHYISHVLHFDSSNCPLYRRFVRILVLFLQSLLFIFDHLVVKLHVIVELLSSILDVIEGRIMNELFEVHRIVVGTISLL